MATPVKCAVQLDRIKGAKIATVHFRAGWAGVLSERQVKDQLSIHDKNRSYEFNSCVARPTATITTSYSKTTIN